MVSELEDTHADMMIDLFLVFDIAMPSVALGSSFAILWAKRRERRRRRRALRLWQRLKRDIDQLHSLGEKIRAHVLRLLAAERYGRMRAEEQARLTRGCDVFLQEVQALRRELSEASEDMDRLRGRALQKLCHGLDRVSEKVAGLRQDAEEREALWSTDASREQSCTRTHREALA